MSLMNYEAFATLPGVGSVFQNIENVIYWGPRVHTWVANSLLVGTARDAGNTPTTLLRTGLLMGMVTATRKMKEWNPAGTDGSQHIVGILAWDQNMQISGVDNDRWWGFVVTTGWVKPANLIIPGETVKGIDGHAQEANIRAQMAGRFLFDDIHNGVLYPYSGGGGGLSESGPFVTKVADYTVTEADNGTHFNTTGAVGTVIFTLPTVQQGLHYRFTSTAAQILRVTGSPADSIIGPGDLDLDTVSTPAAIGHTFDAIAISATKWLIIPGGWAAGTGITALTDNSGGVADNTLVAISAGYVQAEVANNFADVAAKINAIIANGLQVVTD